MVPLRVWVVAIVIAVLTTAALWGTRGHESAFCSGLRRVDEAVDALRDARADEDASRAPGAFDDIADAFDRVDPPRELRGDWAVIVERFHHYADVARLLLVDSPPAAEAPADLARFREAWASFAGHAIDECGRGPGEPLLG